MGCGGLPDDILNLGKGDLVLINGMRCLCVSEPVIRAPEVDETAGHAGDVITITFDAMVGCDIRHVILEFVRSWYRADCLACDIMMDGRFHSTVLGAGMGSTVLSRFADCE